MPFTTGEIANAANAALDFYIKSDALAQTIQDKPLLKALKAKQKTFPGGKQSIKGNVKGDYTTTFMGYSADDTVTYANPANIKQFSFDWKELHAGIALTLSELKIDGISVVDSLNGENTTEHTDREATVLTGLLQDKLDDMGEGTARSFNSMSWLDGTASSKNFAGLQAIIADAPTTGVFAGIDRATNSWWRNRSKVGTNKITSSATNQTLSQTLRFETRQLRRFGGRPTLVLAGSTALDKLESEVTAKGTYTQEGFLNKGKLDIGLADIWMRGVGQVQYDPTLDDIGRADFMYFIDTDKLYLMVMDGEDWKQHAPSRPADKYVLYRAVTWTGALIARQLNCHGVYQVA